MRLTATQVKEAKPRDKQYKLSDGEGMFLLVKPNGGKYWRLKYRIDGKEKQLALGIYPQVSLKDARELRFAARKEISNQKDPAFERKLEKRERLSAAANSFRVVAEEWFDAKISDKSESHKTRTRRLLEKDLFPSLASRPINEITAKELLSVLRKIEKRGAIDTAHRAKQTVGHAFKFGIASGICERDPSNDLAGALKSRTKKHHAAIIEPIEVGKLLNSIDGYQGGMVVRTALKLSPYLFVRSGELRHMQWDEINWKEARWELPAEKMKMKRPHVVPLARQSIALLESIYQLTGRGRYVFPSERGRSRAMSDNAIRSALRTMGYDNETMTPHGFRAMARTLLDEQLGFRVDIIEHQLAHAVKDPTGRAYNRTTHMAERIEMMQRWADYLDTLKQ